MEYGENDVSIFDNFDYAFLGDIHKTNQMVDTEGRVRYPGSTVQQNHGETNDKGYLIWEIQDKEKFNEFTGIQRGIQINILLNQIEMVRLSDEGLNDPSEFDWDVVPTLE